MNILLNEASEASEHTHSLDFLSRVNDYEIYRHYH